MIVTTIRDRIASVCAADPFRWQEAQTPFSFELQPAGQIDDVFRIEVEGGAVIGGFNFTEDRTDRVSIWVAKSYAGHPRLAYAGLITDCTSLRAAIIRDGHANGGDYSVPAAGAELVIQREGGQQYAVGRLSLPVNYETTV